MRDAPMEVQMGICRLLIIDSSKLHWVLFFQHPARTAVFGAGAGSHLALLSSERLGEPPDSDHT
jgi:hypothetical protein